MREFKVNETDEGQTLFKYVSKILKEAPQVVIRKAIRKKNIDLNGSKAQGPEVLKAGDSVKVWFSDETIEKYLPRYGSDAREVKVKKEELSRFKKSILYEDKNILIINKGAGLLSQSDSSGDTSLNDILRAYYACLTAMRTFKPSICNRLDRNTSGIVLCGLTTKGLQVLNEVIRDRSAKKKYIAIVFGEVDGPLSLKGYLAKDRDKNESRILPENPGGNAVPVETVFKPLSKIGMEGVRLTELEAHLITGKSHQIRSHLLSAGFPILGDPKYFTEESRAFSEKAGIKRQLLHAYSLEFPKLSGEFAALSKKLITAPCPEDMNKILKYRR